MNTVAVCSWHPALQDLRVRKFRLSKIKSILDLKHWCFVKKPNLTPTYCCSRCRGTIPGRETVDDPRAPSLVDRPVRYWMKVVMNHSRLTSLKSSAAWLGGNEAETPEHMVFAVFQLVSSHLLGTFPSVAGFRGVWLTREICRHQKSRG